MSVASRLAAVEVCFVQSPPAVPQLGLNSAGVPGGISAVPVDGPLHAGGQVWEPADAEPWCSPIGYQLAVDLIRPRVDLRKRTAVAS
jgi:hypothetical protein